MSHIMGVRLCVAVGPKIAIIDCGDQPFGLRTADKLHQLIHLRFESVVIFLGRR